MKNTMIPEKAQTIIEEIFNKFTELVDVLEPPTSAEKLESATDLEQVHTLFVLKAVGELKESVFVLKHLFEDSEEELTELFTQGGEMTLTEAKLHLMLSMMAEATGIKLEI